MASGTLKVEILTEGVHSGDASGVVPSSFRILRQVLDRLEDSKTGRLLPASFHCEDRKSTRLNSSHLVISYAVFCLKKKNKKPQYDHTEYSQRTSIYHHRRMVAYSMV